MSARCRTCDAPVVWAIMPSGKRMPLDVDRVDEGPVLFELDDRDPPHAHGVASGPGYRSHFASCPDAAKHRRPR